MTQEKVFISEADQYLFAQGTHYDIYKKLGAHLSTEDGVQGVYFGVWAPNAAQVNVIGTFNEWNEESHPMQKLGEGGIWGLFVPGVEEGTMYKFLIYARDGRKLYKADPFANYAEYRPGTASIVTDITGFDWKDSKWMEARDKKDMNKEPMAIYECHIGSFMKHPNISLKHISIILSSIHSTGIRTYKFYIFRIKFFIFYKFFQNGVGRIKIFK